MRTTRPLALGTAAALAVSSLLVVSPAFAADEPTATETSAEETPSAPAIDQEDVPVETPTETPLDESSAITDGPAGNTPEDNPLPDEALVPDVAPVDEFEALEEAGIEVIGIGINDNGDTVVLTSAPVVQTAEAQAALASLAEDHPGDVIINNLGDVPQAAALSIPGGSPYYHDVGSGGEVCSIGFAAWAPGGKPAAITAGHCAHNGTASSTELLLTPSNQPAAGGDGKMVQYGSTSFGVRGKWQFGGPTRRSVQSDPSLSLPNGYPNTANPDLVNSTDIGVINSINPNFTLIPAVTQWNKAQAASNNLTSSVVKVKTAGGKVGEGSVISKSGRTTGLTNGTVTNFTAGWFKISVGWGTYYVYGFTANIKIRPGDSGGPVMQGTRAVAINSGYIEDKPGTPENEDLGFFAYLDQGLKQTDFKGYEVALDIDKPTAVPASGTRVGRGAIITISVPSNATGVTVNGTAVPVSNGKATFKAPTTDGTFSRTIIATNGKSKSASLAVSYTVSKDVDPCAANDSCNLYLNNKWTGVADIPFNSPVTGVEILSGDWDGDGKDTIAFRNGAEYSFLNKSGVSPSVTKAVYGRADDQVLVGDWNGDGKDTLAVRRGSQYFIKNSISNGPADQVVVYGKPDDQVLVGDWNGDKKDTLAVRRGIQYFFKNSMTPGAADSVVVYGKPTDVVLVGDWNGDKKDTLAVRRGSQYFIKNSISGGTADLTQVYGRPTDRVVVGDWNGDKTDTLGVYRGR